jgi:hypothetical protein
MSLPYKGPCELWDVTNGLFNMGSQFLLLARLNYLVNNKNVEDHRNIV